MARHNCALWTSLGYSCPGDVLRQRRLEFEPDKQDLPRVVPLHDFSTKVQPKLERWVFVKVVERAKRALKLYKEQPEAVRKMEPVRAMDIPIKEVAMQPPIPEIIMTGAAASAIMLAWRRFGARGERWLTDAIAEQGVGRKTPVRTTSGRGGGRGVGVAGQGFRFNAAGELAGKMQEVKKRLDAGQPGGGYFPGILG